MKVSVYGLLSALLVLGITSCDDDPPVPDPLTENFTLTIENVQSGKSYLQSGATGFLAPGDSETVTFEAGIGSYLSLATMLVQSNDWFVGFRGNGMGLFDEDGHALPSRIVSGMAAVLDAGTEIDQAPSFGGHQAPRQSGANTGPMEGVVRAYHEATRAIPVASSPNAASRSVGSSKRSAAS